MKNKRKTVFAIFLILSIGNFMRLPNNDHIRLIQFVSIFIIGAFTALLVNEFVVRVRSNKS